MRVIHVAPMLFGPLAASAAVSATRSNSSARSRPMSVANSCASAERFGLGHALAWPSDPDAFRRGVRFRWTDPAQGVDRLIKALPEDAELGVLGSAGHDPARRNAITEAASTRSNWDEMRESAPREVRLGGLRRPMPNRTFSTPERDSRQTLSGTPRCGLQAPHRPPRESLPQAAHETNGQGSQP